MKKIYKRHLKAASTISSEFEKVSYLTSVLRSLLQVAVVSSFEIITKLTPSDEIDLNEFAKRLRKPSDGLPIEIIDGILPFLRTYIDKQFMYGWFESSKPNMEPVSKDLTSWVEFRNKKPAHGVLDIKDAKEWAIKTEQLIKSCLDIFNAIIPSIEEGSVLKLATTNLNNLCLVTPIIRNEEAIVITSVVVSKGIWKLKGQVLSRENAEEFTVNLPEDNIFSIHRPNTSDSYDLAEITINGEKHSFYHNIPIRQTATFEGRKTELDKLKEWIEDEDERCCLVYGDGGYGKTTLVLELLNQIKEDEILDLKKPPPTIISYYTAKMTRWTDEGITHFKSISPVMEESIRELIRCVEPVIGKEWYTISGRQLVDKAAGVLAKEKLTRNDVLLVFDNTETLATSAQEVQELGDFFKLVGKIIGRVIITSRRREFINATPILVEGLSEQESLNLMKRLAIEYNALPIIQTRESKLRRVCQKLTHKPLLIEALVKHISYSKTSIDISLANIFRRSNNELLEFLYEDAWIRMNEAQQKMFLVLVLASCPLDNYSVSRACQEVGIQQTEFQSALDETYFASLTDYGRTYTLEMVDLAKRFFLQQINKLSVDEREILEVLANNVDREAVEHERIEKEYKNDRVAEAFRSDYAKAAKIYVDKGEIQNAIEMYELAIEDDPSNSALHDRFAWLLFNKKQDYDYAEEMAKKALQLNSKNCDALVNIALIYYRKGKISLGDSYIDKAKENGRSLSFCLLRKAIARYHQVKNNMPEMSDISDISDSINNLEEAQYMLESALKIKDTNDRYYSKNKQHIDKYIYLTKLGLKSLKIKQGKIYALTRKID